jgi:serine/threonine-protein kinase RsbW
MSRRSHIGRPPDARPHGKIGRPPLREDRTSPNVGCIATEVLLSTAFDHGSITELRHAVASCAGAAGLIGDRLADFVVAVNELLTNAIRHGGGAGRLKVWRTGDAVVCEVSDSGAGLPAPHPERPSRPVADQPGGWGLWLAEELTDTFDLTSSDKGTVVRISSRTSLTGP